VEATCFIQVDGAEAWQFVIWKTRRKRASRIWIFELRLFAGGHRRCERIDRRANLPSSAEEGWPISWWAPGWCGSDIANRRLPIAHGMPVSGKCSASWISDSWSPIGDLEHPFCTIPGNSPCHKRYR